MRHLPEHLAWHLLATAVICLTYDVIVMVIGPQHRTVSDAIRSSWMAWPCAAIVGLMVALHFVDR